VAAAGGSGGVRAMTVAAAASRGGSAGGSIAERAVHPEELRSDPNLVIDAEYYLAQQVLPVVMRLCAPIEVRDLRCTVHSLGCLNGWRHVLGRVQQCTQVLACSCMHSAWSPSCWLFGPGTATLPSLLVRAHPCVHGCRAPMLHTWRSAWAWTLPVMGTAAAQTPVWQQHSGRRPYRCVTFEAVRLPAQPNCYALVATTLEVYSGMV
jgi:hypothetical protein